MAARPSLLPSEIKTIPEPGKTFYNTYIFTLKEFKLFVKHNQKLADFFAKAVKNDSIGNRISLKFNFFIL